jgi:hypothetical protein
LPGNGDISGDVVQFAVQVRLAVRNSANAAEGVGVSWVNPERPLRVMIIAMTLELRPKIASELP